MAGFLFGGSKKWSVPSRIKRITYLKIMTLGMERVYHCRYYQYDGITIIPIMKYTSNDLEFVRLWADADLL